MTRENISLAEWRTAGSSQPAVDLHVPQARKPETVPHLLARCMADGGRAQILSRDAKRAVPQGDRESEPEAAAAFAQCGGGRVSIHEAAHAIIARLFGVPIGLATIEPTAHFAGRVVGPQADLEESAEKILEDALAICDRVRNGAPPAGESREDLEPWLRHAQEHVIELVAGRDAERIAGFEVPKIDASTDMALALLYAATFTLTDDAAQAFVTYAEVEAAALLKRYWPHVEAVAKALMEHKTLTGEQIDQIITATETQLSLEAEKLRRGYFKEAQERAAAMELELEGNARHHGAIRQLDEDGSELTIKPSHPRWIWRRRVRPLSRLDK